MRGAGVRWLRVLAESRTMLLVLDPAHLSLLQVPVELRSDWELVVGSNEELFVIKVAGVILHHSLRHRRKGRLEAFATIDFSKFPRMERHVGEVERQVINLYLCIVLAVML